VAGLATVTMSIVREFVAYPCRGQEGRVALVLIGMSPSAISFFGVNRKIACARSDGKMKLHAATRCRRHGCMY
jgi:hypothetical protein